MIKFENRGQYRGKLCYNKIMEIIILLSLLAIIGLLIAILVVLRKIFWELSDIRNDIESMIGDNIETQIGEE